MKKVYLLLLSLVVLMIALTGCGKDTDSAKDTSKPITLRYSTMQNKDHIFSPANIWASTQQALLPPTPLRLFRPALLRALQAPLLQVHILTIVTSLITTMYIR